MTESACSICDGSADEMFERREVWRNALWRLTMHSYSALNGFCYLEPIRHIAFITDLDGPEAESLGFTLAAASRVLKRLFAAELIYIYVHGGTIAHLHFHLAPHTAGDFYCDDVVHGDVPEDRIAPEDFASYRNEFESAMPPTPYPGRSVSSP